MKRAWGGWWLVVLGASACERIQVPVEDGQTTQQPALTAPGGGGTSPGAGAGCARTTRPVLREACRATAIRQVCRA